MNSQTAVGISLLAITALIIWYQLDDDGGGAAAQGGGATGPFKSSDQNYFCGRFPDSPICNKDWEDNPIKPREQRPGFGVGYRNQIGGGGWTALNQGRRSMPVLLDSSVIV